MSDCLGGAIILSLLVRSRVITVGCMYVLLDFAGVEKNGKNKNKKESSYKQLLNSIFNREILLQIYCSSNMQ